MTALIIIGIIILVLLLLALLRVGVNAVYDEDGFYAAACIGPIHVRLTGRGKRSSQKSEKKEPVGKKKGGTVETMKSLLPDVLEALRRLRRKLRVDRLTLCYTAAGDDPMKVAVEYGAGQAFMGMIVPVLENNLNVKKRDLTVRADFESEKSSIYLDAKVTLAVWQAVYIACGFLIPLIKKMKTDNTEKAVQK